MSVLSRMEMQEAEILVGKVMASHVEEAVATQQLFAWRDN